MCDLGQAANPGLCLLCWRRFVPQQSNPTLLPSEILQLFAACHGLTQMGNTVVGVDSFLLVPYLQFGHSM